MFFLIYLFIYFSVLSRQKGGRRPTIKLFELDILFVDEILYGLRCSVIFGTQYSSVVDYVICYL